jgi:hypothetical protein
MHAHCTVVTAEGWPLVPQALAATAAERAIATQRLNIRYFASLSADATEEPAPSAADSRAASPPYVFSAAPTPSSRRLQSTGGVVVAAARPRRARARDVLAAAADLADLADARARRKLQAAAPANVSDAAILWMDVNGDARVDTRDALAFADLIKLVDSDAAAHCAWLQSVYYPSLAAPPHSIVRGNAFSDASITSAASPAWQALDPKLIYLRSNASDVLFPPGAACGAPLTAAQTVPQLARFDGSAPLTEAQFLTLVPEVDTADPSALYRAFLRPDEARDWRMFSVRRPQGDCATLWLRRNSSARVDCPGPPQQPQRLLPQPRQLDVGAWCRARAQEAHRWFALCCRTRCLETLRSWSASRP